MGCDIHQKVLVFSKIEQKYVEVHSALDYADDFELVGDRNYDLFGLFGNTGRSYYPEMDNLLYGFPEDIMPKSLLGYYKDDRDYHTISHIGITTLRASLQTYLEKLRNPALFIANDPDDVDENIFNMPEWKESNTYLMKAVERIIEKIGYIYDDYKSKYIDIDKTIFIFYFDN